MSPVTVLDGHDLPVPSSWYIDLPDVERWNRMRAPFTASSIPSDSDVAGFIVDAETIVHQELVRSGYTVPVPTTSPLAFRVARTVAAQLAAYFVEEAAPTSSTERRNHYSRMSEAAKRALRAGELPDLPRKASHRARFPSNAATSFFSRDMEL